MPVPEIDRLAHEILDILGDDLADGERPDESWRLRNRACIAIAGEFREVDPARQPLHRRVVERLQASYLGLEEGSPIWNHTLREFQRSPALALFSLYAALERAEMQERARATTHLRADEVPALPALGGSDCRVVDAIVVPLPDATS